MEPEYLQELKDLIITLEKKQMFDSYGNDIAKLFDIVAEAITKVRTDLEKQVYQGDIENYAKYQDVLLNIRDVELRLEKQINEAKQVSLQDFRNSIKQIYSEIKKVEKQIPVLPDLTYIERRVDDLEEKEVTPDEIIEKINQGVGTIKRERIEQSPESSGQRAGWGAHPLVVKSNGTTIDKVTRILNFTGSTVTRNPDGTVNISGGGGLTEIEISGTVDDNNTTFTAPSEPRYLVINGVWYKASGGAITWSYNAGTITLDKPIGTGGQIWGFGS